MRADRKGPVYAVKCTQVRNGGPIRCIAKEEEMSVNSRAEFVIKEWLKLKPGEKRNLSFTELQAPSCGAFEITLGREACPDMVYGQARQGKRTVYIAVGRNELGDMPIGTWVRLCGMLESLGGRAVELCDVPQGVKR